MSAAAPRQRPWQFVGTWSPSWPASKLAVRTGTNPSLRPVCVGTHPYIICTFPLCHHDRLFWTCTSLSRIEARAKDADILVRDDMQSLCQIPRSSLVVRFSPRPLPKVRLHCSVHNSPGRVTDEEVSRSKSNGQQPGSWMDRY